MKDYPLGAALFLIVLSILGTAAALIILGEESTAFPAMETLFVWCLCGVVVESVSIHHSEGNIYISATEAVLFAAYLSCGVQTALICMLAAFLLKVQCSGKTRRHLFNTPFRLTLFNVTHFIIILFVTDLIYGLLLSLPGNLRILPALAISPLFYFLSCVFNALFYYLEEGRQFRSYLLEILGPFHITALPASIAAVIIAMAYPSYGLFSLLFFLTPLIVTRLSIKEKAGREALPL